MIYELIGTSAPELAVNIFAAVNREPRDNHRRQYLGKPFRSYSFNLGTFFLLK